MRIFDKNRNIMIKSVRKTEILDGTYDGVWSSNMVKVYDKNHIEESADPSKIYSMNDLLNNSIKTVEVNLGIKSMGKKVKIDVFDGWLYVDLSVQDRRDLIIKEII